MFGKKLRKHQNKLKTCRKPPTTIKQHRKSIENIIEKYNKHLSYEKNLSDNTIRNYLSDLSVFNLDG